MKTYLVKRNDQWIVEKRTQAPHDAEHYPAPEGEEPDWLEIVDVKEDENNPPGKMVIINQDVKQQVLAVRAKFISDNEWIEKRQAEYPSHQDMIVALWEKVIENRPQVADELQVKREEIKKKYPKP